MIALNMATRSKDPKPDPMDAILTEIRSRVKKEADQLVSRARRVAEREQQHMREDMNTQLTAHHELSVRASELREQRTAARRAADIRHEELAQRQQFIERIFSSALAAVRNAPRDDRYRAWLRRMVEQALPQLGGGAAHAICNARDSAATAKALEGLPISLAAEHADIAGGIILASADGRVRIDCSAEAALARVQDDLRDVVLNQLGANE